MMQRLESACFPYLPLQLHVRGQVHRVEALIDTGFDGEVSLPAATLGNGEPPDLQIRCLLADESERRVPAYHGEAVIMNLGESARYSVLVLGLGNEALMAKGVIERFRLILDHGERVIVEL